MIISDQVLKAINAHYGDDGINFSDLTQHLKNNRVDSGAPLSDFHHHRGFDESYDGSLIIFHYIDGSALVTGSAMMRLCSYESPS